MDQKQLGEKRVYLAHTSSHSPSLKEVRPGTQAGKERGDETSLGGEGGTQRGSATYWLAHPAFLESSGLPGVSSNALGPPISGIN